MLGFGVELSVGVYVRHNVRVEAGDMFSHGSGSISSLGRRHWQQR